MMNPDFIQEVKEMLPDSVREREPMAEHTSWGIGGPAELFVRPSGESELTGLMQRAGEERVPVFILGRGSNILVADTGIPGITVSLADMEQKTECRGTEMVCGGGVRLEHLLQTGIRNGLGGLVPLAGIPGTAGGALATNAGTGGTGACDLVSWVEIITADGRKRLNGDEVTAGYRTSSIKGSGAVIRAAFELHEEAPEKIKEEIAAKLRRRTKTQPVADRSAGSVFRNPAGHSAGALIDGCGCKGWTEGGAAVSEKHANFIINRGDARAADVRRLMERIRETVLRDTGVTLEPEVETVG